jgi:2'-5' RNA ligase
MRLFIASFLATEAAEYYDDLTAAIVARHPAALRSIPRGSAHFTHAFLGEVTGLSPTELADDIGNAVAGRPAIAIELCAPTVLRTGRGPRLIMAPVGVGADELTALSEAVLRALRLRPTLATLRSAKAPHVTLARFRKRSSIRDGRAVMEILASSRHPRRPSRIAGVQLVRSLLTPEGPRYETLTHHSLQ